MTLEGANNFSDNNNSITYTVNSTQSGQYCVVIPKNTDNKINMLVDLNMKNSFDSVINNKTNKEELVKLIDEEYTHIIGEYPSGILVLPMLDINELNNAIVSNDKQKMLAETKKIGNITSELYQKLSNGDIDKSKIDQKIIIIKKTDTDNKFVDWLKEQMPNFVDGINYEELKNKDVSNIDLGNVNPFTGENSNNVDAVPVNDIFGTTDNSDNTTLNNEIQSSEPTQPVNVENTPEQLPSDNISNDTNNDIIEPQPIADTKLETTQALPTSNNDISTNETTPDSTDNQENHELDKKSGGFANLLILVVILIGVTVASIELGKILYNTFGS